jgi:hypothetical protein
MAKRKNAEGTEVESTEDDELGPAMPTGRFVAKTPIQIMDEETKTPRVLQIGEVLPDGCDTKRKLREWLANGTIDHEYQDS